MSTVPMTKEGAERLEAELNRLKGEDRPAIINAISEARAHGDLKENAEYHAAKEKQSFIEGRIRDIEGKLSNCQVIDVTTIANEGNVIFGSTVTLLNIDTDDEVKYKIVGEDEIDIEAGKISVASPIARSLVGKRVDDEVTVITPGGESNFEIIAVDYV